VGLRTRRWNDPREPDDGFRVLVTRFRPRGISKADETWDEWWPEVAPSRELLAAFHGKDEAPISWEAYVPRYREEMKGQLFRIRALAGRVAGGETVTLLCSSACADPARCHRTLLAELVERAVSLGRAPPRRSPP
jgi:uncharacterized protein YeaO (DUF488 family)